MEKIIPLSSTSSAFPGESKSVGDELILAVLCFSKENEMGSLTTAFYDDPEAHMEELDNYDLVYVLKTTFKK